MTAIANLTLADGQATPANVTFAPQDCTPALATWTNRSSGIGIGTPSVTLSVLNGKDSCRVKGKVVLPILEAISGDAGGYTPSPKVAYSMLASFDIVSPNRATLQNRKDVRAFIKNLLIDAVVTKAVEEFERPF